MDPAEIARFAALAEEWWLPDGKMRPIHRLNPTRIAFLRDRACAHFGRDPETEKPLRNLSLIDVGCGGGLLSEPMARLGANTVGIDAAADAVAVAARHAGDLAIDYRHAAVEDVAGERFDIVLAMEIIEHVGDREAFLAALAELLKPGGLIVLATINRTPQSFALAIVAAEYIFGWLPRGTHQWDKFVRPAELARGLRHNGVTVSEITGVRYDPFADTWHLSPNVTVNFILAGSKS